MKQQIEGVGNVEIKYENENDAKIFIGRQLVIWRNGKWADDNKGKSYLNWQARERLVKELGLK